MARARDKHIRVDLLLPPDLNALVEGWRAAQRAIPSKSEAIRALVRIGLDHDLQGIG